MAASAHNILSARLVEQAGFPVVWASGLELPAAKGIPDANILTMSEVLESARALAGAVAIPILTDCDSGYGDVGNVAAMVNSFEAASVAGVCIEDKPFPKLNSLAVGAQDLVSVEDMVAMLQKMSEFLAAKAAVTERAAELVSKLSEMELSKQRSDHR
jgi:phosphoenolpyruvate phosphomutase